jgi:predicted extracellular nuclease
MKKVYLIILIVFSFITPVIGQISLTGANYTQDFNTLANTGTTNNLTIPGWLLTETGGGARDNEQYAFDNGGSNTGDTYSYGTTSATERALGGLRSGTLIPVVGAWFTNNTGAALSSISISYTGEEWRLGTAARTDRLDFQYSLNATDLVTGTWVDVDALDFTTPNTVTTGAKDGNLPANQTAISNTITGLSIPNGASFFIRWNDLDASGADDGLSIDDFTISTSGAPSNVLSVAAGSNASEPSTNGSFTLSFTPSTTGSTTFDYALTGTSTFNTDYSVTLSGSATPSPLTTATGTITVPSSTSSITVTITPIDDPTAEGSETIILTLSNPNPGSGYTIGTASANISLTDDDVVATPLHTIQGTGSAATAGSFTVEAIVTGIYPTLSPAGFYIQEEDADADADPNTSEGIFVVSATPVAVGDKVRVAGTVLEGAASPSFNQAVFSTATVTIINSGNPVPATVDITLPVTAIADYEKYEGMRVRFPGTLTVTDNDNLGSFGELKLSSGGLVYQPTQIVDPNDDPASGNNSSGASNVAAVNALIASNNLRTILLDDGRGAIPTLPYVNVDNTVRVGSTIDNITGILGFAFSQYRIQPIAAAVPSFTHAARPSVPGYGAGANLKVASFNVLNYFDGTPNAGLPNPIAAGFPTPRGAHSATEFTRQRDKIINALSGPGPDYINADVVGLIEIANNGTNNPSAIQNLVDGLNSVMGAGTYAFINDGATTQTNNTDQIRCAIIYKPSVVTPVGAAMLGNNAIFDRPPLAQTFNLISTNKTFNFIVNHFKSKGGTGTGADADQGDGQAAFNDRRKQQATALLTFINGTVIPTSGTNRIISVGDYNAYYEEDPMDILRTGGYTVASSATSYSYLFGGQLGSLDHAVVSPSLTGTITGIAKWNTNSAEPTYLDYNDAISTNGSDPVNPWASTYTPSEWRASDHDAILMGLLLDATLPVTLVNFSATKENTSSKISWTTSQEINSRQFIVERSANGSVWQTVAIVPAAGNSNSPIDYSIIDATPAKGINLYRLKSIDLDAKFEYSAIRRINFDNKYTFSIYPNPASDVIQVIVDNASVLNATLQILNTQSQVLISKQLNATNQPVQVNVSSLASGLYFIRIITPDGTVNVQKFTKH